MKVKTPLFFVPFLVIAVFFGLVNIIHAFTGPSGNPPTGTGETGSAPPSAGYLTRTANTTLTSETDLSSLSASDGYLKIANDGTPSVPAAATVRTDLGAAASGPNSDITSITGLTTDLAVAHGGTGLSTLTLNNVILGNGASAPLFVAPGVSGNVLTSNGTTWTSAAPTGSGWTDSGIYVHTTTLTDSVGIGTATPGTLLEVSGSSPNPIKINRTSAANASIQYTNTAGTMYAGLNPTAGWAVGSNIDLSASPFLTVAATTGNVGIGSTPSAAEKLKVLLSSGLGASIGSGGNDGSVALYVTPATTTQQGLIVRGLASQSAAILKIQSSTPSDLLSVWPNGNVGIGIDPDTYKLNVNGNTNIVGNLTISGSCTGCGGGSPSATYITQTPDATLTAEQALSTLATGYMKVTTGTGVVSSQAVPIPLTDGGTAATTSVGARTSLGAAASGANSDITSITGLTTDLSVAQGGTGASTLTGLVLGNGAAAFTATTTSAGIAGAISDETGTGAVVLATNPTFPSSITVSGTTVNVGVADTTAGNLLLHGNGTATTEGGEIFLGLAADHDTVFNGWYIDANADDLRFFSADGGVSSGTIILSAEGQFRLPKTTGATAGILIGGDANLYRNAANELKTDDSLVVAGTLTVSGGCTGCGGGAPPGATYITQTADATLTGEIALADLSASDGYLKVANDGTPSIPAAATVRTDIGAAASGANSDITSITGLTTDLSVAQGGTGASTLTANNVILGNGTSAPLFVAPGTSQNVLTSNGTTWTSGIPTIFLRSDADDQMDGRLVISQGSNGPAYSAAPLEIRELWNAGAGEAPTITFHYSGAVASQIGFLKGDNSSDVSVIDNPGTGYETLRVRDLKIGATQFIDGSRNIVNGGTGTFSGNLTTTGDVTANSVIVGANGTFGAYTSANTDITALVPGTAGGTLLRAQPNAHFVIALDGNDNSDSFNILSHTATTGTGSQKPVDTNVFSVSRLGSVNIPGSLTVGSCTGCGGGAPSGAGYLTRTADATLTAETDLSSLSASDGYLKIANDGTPSVPAAATVRTDIGAAASGANSDITSITGLTTDLDEAFIPKLDSEDTRATNPNPEAYTSALKADFKQNTIDGLADGGTYHGVISYRPYGITTDFSGGPMAQLGFTTNSNIWTRFSTGATTWGTWDQILTSKTDVTVAQGGTGLSTLTANNVILGNGTSTPLFVAPGTSGNVLTSNGTTWTSSAPAATGAPSAATYLTNTPDATLSAEVALSGLSASAGYVYVDAADTVSIPAFATTRGHIGAAASGANSDITSITGLTTDLSVAQGGTGTSTGSITGTGALAFTSGGATTVSLKPGTNSTTAVQLQNAAGTSILNVDSTNSRVGIGLTNPQSALHVNGEIRWGGSSAAPYTYSHVDVNGLYIEQKGTNTTNENIRIQASKSGIGTDYSQFHIDPTSGFQFSAVGTGNNSVGIGVAPSYKLDVASGGATTARFGTGASDTVVIGGGTGKITVGTVDPPYTINGKKYATYLPSMTGIKEETTGILKLACTGLVCESEIDFASVPEGSDLWLFSKATNLKDNFERMTVLATPSFDGRVWYEKDAANNRLTVFASPASIQNAIMEVSYRLTAPRFDSVNLPNTREEDGIIGLEPDNYNEDTSSKYRN